MEENSLKQVFVGKKFEKFEKKVFSIPAFLFNGIYFAYRKMLIHAILISLMVSFIDTLAINLLNIPLMIIAILCIHIAIGLFFPLWYKKFYNNKVKKIISKNSSSSESNILKIVQKSGGTSILYIIIFIIINSISTNFFNNTIQNNLLKPPSLTTSNQEMTSNFVKDIEFTSKSSGFGTYHLTSGYADDLVVYNCTSDEIDLLYLTTDYEELSADIYYTTNNGENIITSYKLYNNETNEDFTNYTDENSIIEALGYYSEGSYEEILTLIEFSDTKGAGFKDNVSYYYYTYTFETENGKQIEFMYKIYDSSKDKSDIIEKNQKYKVNFNVEDGTFKNEYIITDIEKVN